LLTLAPTKVELKIDTAAKSNVRVRFRSINETAS